MLKSSLEMMALELVSLMMVLHHRNLHPDHEDKAVRGGGPRLDPVGQKMTAFRRLRVSKREAKREARKEVKVRLTNRANHVVAVEAGVVGVGADGVLINVLRKKAVLNPVLKIVKIFRATVGILMENEMRGKGRRRK
jgi:hypothetical protein